jgi:hypothetical protein
MHQTALAWCCRKELLHGRQQSFMAIGHNEIDLRRSAPPQVVEHTHPSLFILLSTSAQRQHLFVSG